MKNALHVTKRTPVWIFSRSVVQTVSENVHKAKPGGEIWKSLPRSVSLHGLRMIEVVAQGRANPRMEAKYRISKTPPGVATTEPIVGPSHCIPQVARSMPSVALTGQPEILSRKRSNPYGLQAVEAGARAQKMHEERLRALEARDQKAQTSSNSVVLGQEAPQLSSRKARKAHRRKRQNDTEIGNGTVNKGLTINMDGTGIIGVYFQDDPSMGFTSLEDAAAYFRAQARLCAQVDVVPRGGPVSTKIAASEAPPEILFDESMPQVRCLLSTTRESVPVREKLDWYRPPLSPKHPNAVESFCQAPVSLPVDSCCPKRLCQSIERHGSTQSEGKYSPYARLQLSGSCPLAVLSHEPAPHVYVPPVAYASFILPHTLEREDRRILGVSSTADADEQVLQLERFRTRLLLTSLGFELPIGSANSSTTLIATEPPISKSGQPWL